MTDNVAIALIGSISATAVGIFNAYAIMKTHGTLKQVQEQTNGIQAKLVVAEKQVSFQEGKDSEKNNPS